MAHQDVDELVVHLEKSLELSIMEHGVKLVGAALVNRNLNKWGVRNILRSSWKELGEVDVKWVQENTSIITVRDESTTAKILNQVPWLVMKQNFSVNRWHPELALEEIKMEMVPFWVQIHGVLLCLTSETNVRRLSKEIGEFLEFEDPSKARGFLRRRLQDFCFQCGRISHANTDCFFKLIKGGTAGFGEWTKMASIQDVVESPRSLTIGVGGKEDQ
ncbi:uncharacterized protein [Malus domestica]|uniref:uncharacterized protein n=1 Tax=Malus domestica TaxID=3750 RepID=UPI003974DC7D